MVALFVFLLFSLSLWGEEIHGRLVDPEGAAVEGETILLRRPSQPAIAKAISGANGAYHIVVPGAGSYVLTVRRPGFAKAEVAVEVRSGEVSQVTIPLTLDFVSARVSVAAEANQPVSTDASAQDVTVISRGQLDGPRLTLLSDVVEGQTGAHVLKTSPTLGSIFVRGLTGKNVSVYRDGVRYTNSAQRGGISTFLNLNQPESLESVEILRGPSSAQYGSDSIGGTVAMFSRLPDMTGWQAEAGALFGSQANAFGLNSAVAYSSERGGFTAALNGLRSSTLRTGGGLDSHAAVTRFLGLPSTVMGRRLPDTAFTAYGGVFHGQLAASEKSQWSGHYERSQQDGGKRYDQLLGGDGNWIADLRNLMLDFGYLRHQRFLANGAGLLSLTGSYNAQREERVNQGGQGNPAGTITHQYEKTKVWGFQGLADRRWGALQLAGGLDTYWERIAAPSFTVNPVTGAVALVRPRIPDGATYSSYGGFAQAVVRPVRDRVRLTGVVRYGGSSYGSRAGNSPLVNGRPLWPDDSLTARAWTGRAGASVWATPWLALHTHWSRGFRVPNVTDLGTLGLQGNGQYEAAVADLAGREARVGNRADDLAVAAGPVERLRPEFSNNFDGGVRVRRDKWAAEVTAFWLQLTNTIVSQTLILPAGVTGQALGEQPIIRQLASGAVFVPGSSSPVLVRANFSGARMRGVEHSASARLTSRWSVRENVTYLYAEDSLTGLPPDIEPGVPPLTANPVIRWQGPRSVWVEGYATLAGRQDRLSSLALSDRRIGNPRSRANIQSFFNNGARSRGLVSNGILIPTGETLAQVQNRVLGTLNSAPQFAAIPGYAVWGVRAGFSLAERTQLTVDASNLGDKNYRGIGWGVDGAGRAIAIRLRHTF